MSKPRPSAAHRLMLRALHARRGHAWRTCAIRSLVAAAALLALLRRLV